MSVVERSLMRPIHLLPVGAEVGGCGGVDGPMDGDWAIRALFSLDLGAGIAEGRWSTGRGLQGWVERQVA